MASNILPRSNFVTCCLAIILTLVDILLFSLLEQQLFATLLCFYIMYIFSDPTLKLHRAPKILNWLMIGFFLLLLSLESFYFNGSCIATLLYLVPATLIGMVLRQILYKSELQGHILLIFCLLAHSLIIDYLSLPEGTWAAYTATKILVNMLVMVIFFNLAIRSMALRPVLRS